MRKIASNSRIVTIHMKVSGIRQGEHVMYVYIINMEDLSKFFMLCMGFAQSLSRSGYRRRILHKG
eukprot:4067546-Karenia_brevis.AAC.1